MSQKSDNKVWLKGTIVFVSMILVGGAVAMIGSGTATTIGAALILIGVVGLLLVWFLWAPTSYLR